MTAEELRDSDRRLTDAAMGGFLESDPLVVLLAAMVDGSDDPVDPSPAELRAFVAAVQAGRPAPRSVARAVVPALVIGGSLLVGGAAAASNGSLPDPLQDVAHEMADLVGIDVPPSDDAPPDRPANAGGVEGVGSDGTAPGRGGIVPGTGADGGGNGIGSLGTPPGQGGTVPGTGTDAGSNGVEADGTPPVPAVVPEDPGSQGAPRAPLPQQAETPPSTTPPTTRSTSDSRPSQPTPPTEARNGSAEDGVNDGQGRGRAARDG